MIIETKKDLIKFRKSLKQSKREFAENVGYSYSYICQVERGAIGFYTGLKNAVNGYKIRLEAYEKANGAYIETMARCYCDSYEDHVHEQIEQEDKEVNRILYGFALIAFIAIAGVILWIYKS
jgi:predicted transcriptional regulator